MPSSLGIPQGLEADDTTPFREDLKNGYAFGSVDEAGKILAGAPDKRIVNGEENGKDLRVDQSGHFEFGGSWGVSAMMIGFPLLMYYMWIGATYYDGRLPSPREDQDIFQFVTSLFKLAYDGAFPSLKAWAMYWTFFIFEALCYIYLPGITTKGKPLEHEGGKQLVYYCSGIWSFYVTIAVMATLHLTGLFTLYTIIDEFGPLMSVAIITGFIISIIAYFSALYRGAQHRMTGSFLYDFFMGAELNPRMLGILDFKMFFEVRLPWYILLMVTSAAAARQYEQLGYVSGEMAFLVMAHFLYANACAKGEECIVTTWLVHPIIPLHLHSIFFIKTDDRDMYYEKWGFMLIFWNLAGVPLSYCHCTLYLANHEASEYRWNRYALVLLFVSYLFVYWIWDTTNSQKNNFRQQERGTFTKRKAFPQLPWQTVQNPQTIKTNTGDSILVDGWCMSFVLSPSHPSPPPPPSPQKNILSPLLKKIRRLRPQNPLHSRSLLRLNMGSRHRLPQPPTLVLPHFLRVYDHSSRHSRYSTLRS